jgi:hypothetical protein
MNPPQGERLGPTWTARLLAIAVAGLAPAAPALAKPEAEPFSAAVAPLVKQYCIDCHGGEKPEAGFSLDGLKGDFSRPEELKAWQSALDRIESHEMPPEDAEQPSETERQRAGRWLTAALTAAGVTLDEGKWLAPSKGNYVDHKALFSTAKPTDPTGTPARLWRLQGPAYEQYVDWLIKEFKLGLRNYGEHKLTAPWNFTPQRDFADYSSAHRVGEAEMEFLMRNATTLADAFVKRHTGSKASTGFVNEVAVLCKAGPAATLEQAAAAVAPTFQALFGRQPTADESKAYGAFLRKAATELGGPEAAKQFLVLLLCQPEMLYRIEVPDHGRPRDMIAPAALARSIAFTLTDVSPDRPLVEAASAGKLATAAGVAAEVRRILDDPQTPKPRILRFFQEYFGYPQAPGVFKDEATRKSNGFREAFDANFFVSDADKLVQAVLADDKEVLRTLLTTTKSYVMTLGPERQVHNMKDEERLRRKRIEANEQAAIAVYEVPIKERADWDPNRIYDLPPEHRLGLLTHPAWLVAQSGNFDNHAIHRGRWVREKLLGGRVPDVPITVNAMLPDEPHRSLRDRMQATREAYCWNCHKMMDPLGLPFEQFDHLGRFRTAEQVVDKEATESPKNADRKTGEPRQRLYKKVALDTTGAVTDAIDPKLDGPVKDPFELIRRLADSEHVEQVFVRHAFRYFLGRNETLADGPTLVAAHRAYRDSGGSMKALITSLLSSDAFLYRYRTTAD